MDKKRLLDDIQGQIKAIAEEVKGVLRAVLESDKGLNEKVGHNTLVDSNLYKELEVGVTEDNFEVVTMLVNDYIEYIEEGRAPGSYPPPTVIAAWCQRKGIPSDNRTVYLICHSIYENGIAPRPIFDGEGGVWSIIEEYWDDWSEMVFNTLTEQLDDYFNEK